MTIFEDIDSAFIEKFHHLLLFLTIDLLIVFVRFTFLQKLLAMILQQVISDRLPSFVKILIMLRQYIVFPNIQTIHTFRYLKFFTYMESKTSYFYYPFCTFFCTTRVGIQIFYPFIGSICHTSF